MADIYPIRPLPWTQIHSACVPAFNLNSELAGACL